MRLFSRQSSSSQQAGAPPVSLLSTSSNHVVKAALLFSLPNSPATTIIFSEWHLLDLLLSVLRKASIFIPFLVGAETLQTVSVGEIPPLHIAVSQKDY